MKILIKTLITITISTILVSTASAAPQPDTPYNLLKPWAHAWLKNICLAGYNEIPQYFRSSSVCWWIRLNSQGEIVEEKLVGTSGSDLHDHLALNIIRRAAPFPCPIDFKKSKSVISSAKIYISRSPQVYLDDSKISRKAVNTSISQRYLASWFKNAETRITSHRNFLLSKSGMDKDPMSDSVYSPILFKFKLTLNGKIIDLSLLKSSNINELDELFQRALEKSSPLSGIPSKLPQRFGLVASIPISESEPVKLWFASQGRRSLVNNGVASEAEVKANILKIISRKTKVSHGDSLY